ncbi:sulfur carrier protein [Geothermobacter ehrlichii]|uniref:Sulfur carrier protein n=1 Tax=Geothermobacter ehrlichii TaxID=213224 RepID=A0A5D3WGF4_9BACT|nr:sulfur carrier protein ThiS [Geothermobacter ehrlichii]TYO96379.1 sulfur carrier protein [Geothermobacter ehrlichii]
MNVIVNGKGMDVADGMTVTGLLGLLQLDASRVAVERNQNIVARADFDSTELLEDDRLEIVQFVGGG